MERKCNEFSPAVEKQNGLPGASGFDSGIVDS